MLPKILILFTLGMLIITSPKTSCLHGTDKTDLFQVLSYRSEIAIMLKYYL